jgi:double-stranded uracil-DNA glycosylase
MLLTNPTPPSAVLPDVLEAGLDLVICGSAVGTASAMRAGYYAGPGNQFWRTLQRVGLTPEELSPRDSRSLLGFGIGLTDLVKSQAGNDADIRFGSLDRPRLERAIFHYRPRFLCFNGKRTAKEYFGTRSVEYGLQSACIGATRLFVAPSTSGAARGAWNLAVWRELSELVRATAA